MKGFTKMSSVKSLWIINSLCSCYTVQLLSLESSRAFKILDIRIRITSVIQKVKNNPNGLVVGKVFIAQTGNLFCANIARYWVKRRRAKIVIVQFINNLILKLNDILQKCWQPCLSWEDGWVRPMFFLLKQKQKRKLVQNSEVCKNKVQKNHKMLTVWPRGWPCPSPIHSAGP